ncbi:MAG: DUF6493 family protein [Mycobacteriales bacterium]
MTDTLTYEAVARVDRGVIHGLIARFGGPAQKARYEFAWQRDVALFEAIDNALTAAAAGTTAEPAAAPRWLDGLVRRELEESARSYTSSERFVRNRLLERLGLVQLEPDDTYILAMVSALGSDKVAKLKADPELVELALWRVFEVEGGGEVSLSNVDRFGGQQWRNAFLALTADGTLERGRVLAECLTALCRGFSAYRAGWYPATFLALSPTDKELSELQNPLRRLLGASVPATVTFSVNLLIRLHKAGRLELAETLGCLPPAVLVKTKGTALDVLRLAKAAACEHRAAVAEIAHTGLGHPHADVQRAAADLLAVVGEADTVAAVTDELMPSVRHDLGLAAEVPSRTHEPVAQYLVPALPAVTHADLAERAAALLEDSSDVGEVEAVLAALVEPGSEDRLAPLGKRAKAVAARGPNTDVGDAWLPGQVARLILGLLKEPTPPAEPAVPAFRFITRRLSELRQTSSPLLATPDMPGGWVSAEALVTRLAVTDSPPHHDLVAGLLRLHPDGREQFMRSAVPPAVKFALDGLGPTKHGRREGPDAWWVAAERSRAPYNSSEQPQLHGEVRAYTWNQDGRQGVTRYGRFSVSTFGSHGQPDDLPTECGSRHSANWSLHSGRDFGDWAYSAAAIWPHDAEHFLALTCLPVLESPNAVAAAHDVPRVLDAFARHPGRLGPLAAHTLAAGLAAGRRDYRLHAVDAFLDLVPTGRLAVGALVSALAEFWEIRPRNRLAESLTAVSQGSGGSDAVVGVLTGFLPCLPPDAHGLAGLLDLLRDETIRGGRQFSDPELRQWLGRHRGSSKVSKTARLLLE